MDTSSGPGPRMPRDEGCKPQKSHWSTREVDAVTWEKDRTNWRQCQQESKRQAETEGLITNSNTKGDGDGSSCASFITS